MTHRIARAAALVLPALAAWSAWGRGTPAGTTITNQAEVNFSLGGSARTARSNIASVEVAEIVDLELFVQTPQRLVYGGAAGQPVRLTLANVGNGPESFALAVRHAVPGDDFDPLQSAPAIWFDTDSDGTLGGADTPYSPGAGDPVLLPDQSVAFFVVSDIPAAVADGDVGLIEVEATAGSGAGVPGQSFTGSGAGGVDVVIGASGGSAQVTAEYFVGIVEIEVSKAAVVRDGAGGTMPEAGATIDYSISVAATGTGTAEGTVLRDPIPAGTTYLAGSLRLDGLPVTDTVDADAGRFEPEPAAIHVDLGALAAGDPARAVSFSVTID